MSNKKKKESEIEKRTRELIESEEKYKSLAKNSPFGISVISKEGVYEYINPKFTEILGYTLEDTPTGKDWLKKSYPDPEYRKKVLACWISDFKKAGIGESRPRVFTVTCKDGSKKEIQFIPVTLKNGKQFVTYEDITPQRETERKLSAIYDLSREMSLSLDLDQISKIILDATEKVLNFDYIDLFLLDEETNELHLIASRGWKERKIYTRIPLSGEKGITAYVARTGKSLNVPDVRKDKRYLSSTKEAKSELSVPIKIRNKVIGVIDAESEELDAFAEVDQRLLETLASQTAIAIENARLFGEISSLKEFNETLVNSLNEGIWVEDEKGFCTYANPKMNEMLGYESLLGKHWKEIIVPEELDHMQKETSTRQYGSKSSYETIFLTNNGERIPMIVSATPLFEKGKFIGTITVFVDIREQKWAEESLKESEELYRSLSEFNEKLLENSPAGIMNIDKEMKVEYENPEMRRILGLPFGRELSAMGMNVREVPLIEESGSSSIFNELIKGKKAAEEASFTFPNGEKGYLTLRGVPLLEDSKFAGAVLIFNDITGLKRAEEALQKNKNKIEQLHKIAAQMEAAQLEEEVYQLIIDATKRILEFSICSVSIVDGDRLEIKTTSYEEIPKIRYISIDEGVMGRTYRTGKSYLVNDLRKDKDAKPSEERFRSALSIPIWNVGVFLGISDELDTFTQDDLEMAELLISHATEALKRIQSEKALQESEEKYRLISENTDDIIALATFSLKPVYTYISSSIKSLGYEPEEVIGKPCFDFVHPDDKKRLLPLLRKYISAKTKKFFTGKDSEVSETIENRVRDKSGNWHYLQSTTNLIGNQILFVARDITERKKMEEELEESRKHFQTLFDSMIDPVVIVDSKGKFLEITDRVEEITGFKKEELLGKNFLKTKVVTAKSKAILIKNLSKRMMGMKVAPYEIEMLTKDGRKLPYEVNAAKIEYKGKTADMVVFRDITERKKAEKALKESEEKYKELVQNANSIVMRLDTEGNITFFNEFAQSFFGYAENEIIGRNLVGTIVPKIESSGRDLEALIEDLKRDPDRYAINENENIRKNGERVWVLWTNKPILDDRGRIVGILCIGTDATERKKIEEALQKERDKTQKYLDVVGVMLVVLDADQKVTLINKKGCEILGYKEKDIIGKNWTDNFTPEKIRNEVKTVYEKLFVGEIEPVKYNENPVLTKSGEERIIAWYNSVLRDEAGNIIGILSSGEDITERKKIEEELRESERELSTIFNSVKDGIVVMDKTGKIIKINRRITEVGGYTEKDVIGKRFSAFKFFTLKSLSKMAIAFTKIVTGVEVPPFEVELKTKDGKKLYLETYASPVKKNGKMIGVVSILRNITERKKAEEVLRESEEKFRTLTENINIGIYRNTLGPKGKFIEANPAIIRMFGYGDKEEFLKINVSDLYQHPKDRKNQNEKMLKDGFVKNEELQLKKKDGNQFYGSVTAVAVKDEKGKVKYYDGIIEDITKRKRAEETLKKSEEKYKYLIDHISDITVIVDKSGKFQFANKKAVETMGYSMEEIIGMPFLEIVLEEYAPILFDALKQEFEGKPVPAMEIKIKTKEGDIKILGMAEGSAPIYENGEVVGIQITARDITERKKVEEEIRRLKEFNEGIIQSMAEGIVVENAEGYFIFVNPAAADLLGYSPSELLGQHWAVIVPPDQQPIVQAADERRTRGETDHYELELVRKGGRRLSVLVSGSPRFEEDRFVGTLAVFTDITERKHFEEQREQARKEAEFYADVLAHDVSNIDQITLGYLYLLKNAKDEKTRKKNINNIKKSIMKSARLADNIKTLKKIKDTKLEKFDLNESIGRSVEKIKAYVDREIQVNLNIDKKYHVNANDFLDKVFFNILENAVEFTLQDSVIIDIKTEEKRGMCNIHIRDRGIGIPENKKKDILKNLETMSKRTGMGLCLVKKILDKFNGAFEIRDAEKGTEIVICIPVMI